MTTLIWKRGNCPYRIAVDGPEEVIEKLKDLKNVWQMTFSYRPLKVPVQMKLDGMEYQLYSIKKGMPR